MLPPPSIPSHEPHYHLRRRHQSSAAEYHDQPKPNAPGDQDVRISVDGSGGTLNARDTTKAADFELVGTSDEGEPLGFYQTCTYQDFHQTTRPVLIMQQVSTNPPMSFLLSSPHSHKI